MTRRRRRPGGARPWRRRRLLDDRGLNTVEWVVLAAAVIGMAVVVTTFLDGYLAGWMAELPSAPGG